MRIHTCGHKLKHNERFDAIFCSECDIWTEKKCDDPNCFFCAFRPEKPSLVLDNIKKKKHNEVSLN
jgi:hypothetical protein